MVSRKSNLPTGLRLTIHFDSLLMLMPRNQLQQVTTITTTIITPFMLTSPITIIIT